jgi:hypothetical protein
MDYCFRGNSSNRDYECVFSAVSPFMVTHLSHPRTKLTELLAAVEQHVESGRYVLFWVWFSSLSH